MPSAPPSAAGRTRVWRPSWPCPATSIMAVHRRGAGDPSYRIDPAGRHWRAIRTPAGPATLTLNPRPTDGTVIGTAWGEGADWILDTLPRLLGAEDDVSAFRPIHPVLIAAHRAHQHWRISTSGLVFQSLLPTVIEQKVTGQEAFGGYRRLVRRFGEPAPGPVESLQLFVPPSADQVARIPSWEWLALPVDPARSRAAVIVAQRESALQRLAGDALALDRALLSLPGIGRWTSAEVRSRALGDPDAVSFGDYHVAKDIGWALLGREIDDDALEVLLEPWRGQRYRVQALLGLARLHRPRRGPRMAPRTHLPVRRYGSHA